MMLSQSFKKYQDTIGVTKIIVIILNIANDEETIFFKKPIIRLLKLGRILFNISELLSWKVFFCKYSIIKLTFWFKALITVGNSIKNLFN